MKKQLFLSIAGIVFILCSPNIYASDSSPWGTCAVWPFNLSPTRTSYNSNLWKQNQWRATYTPQLDSMKNCGLTWNRPNCLPGGEIEGVNKYSK